MEPEEPQASITEHFTELEDPRRFNRRHRLMDILVIAICAAIAGADGWEHVECIIRAMPTIDSDRCRPPVLDHAVHPFRWHGVQFFRDTGISGRHAPESGDERLVQ